jgi:hypothetical protein
MTPDDKLRRDLSMAQTSEAKGKACDDGRDMLLATTTSITDLTARYATVALRGPSESAKHVKRQLDDMKALAELLQLILNAGEAERAALEAAEAQAVPELRAIVSLANEKRTALVKLYRKLYPDLVRAALPLILATVDTLQSSASALQAAIRAPALARAKVKIDLVPLTLFAHGQGVGTVLDILPIVPALADPDAPETHLAPHYPPRPVLPPAPAAEPRPAPGPSTLRSWTTTQEFAPLPVGSMGPPPIAPSYVEAAARALT